MDIIIIVGIVSFAVVGILMIMVLLARRQEEEYDFLSSSLGINTTPPIQITEPQAKCATCGAYIDEINKVETPIYFKYYCNDHKKPYTMVHSGFYGYKHTTYFGTVEMSEDGTPVGYKKIKKN